MNHDDKKLLNEARFRLEQASRALLPKYVRTPVGMRLQEGTTDDIHEALVEIQIAQSTLTSLERHLSKEKEAPQ